MSNGRPLATEVSDEGTPLERALSRLDVALIQLVNHGKICLGTNHSRILIEAHRLLEQAREEKEKT